MTLITTHKDTGCQIYQQEDGRYFVADAMLSRKDINTLSEAISYCNALYSAW